MAKTKTPYSHVRNIVILIALVGLVMYFMPNTDSSLTIIAAGLDTPWAIDFLPDGRLVFTERPGRVNVIEDGKVKLVGTVVVAEEAESGLMGIAVDPQFEITRQIYLYHTADDGNRVSRFTLNGTLKDETVLLDKIPNALYHDGGRIKFGPDGLLYVTTGDATNLSTAQDVNSLAGKILRMNKNGSVPLDNPFGNYVYSYGHRNSQGLAWRDGTLYASEHGSTRNDEINIVEKGKNYGWPKQCTDTGDFVQPIRCFTTFTMAPAGIAIHKDTLYVAGLRGSQVRAIDIKTLEEKEFIKDLGRIRDVVVHDGILYVATSNRDGRGVPAIDDDKIVAVKLK